MCFGLGVLMGMIAIGAATVPDRRSEVVVQADPVLPDGVGLVDINAMLDVGFVMIDPEGFEIDGFDDASDNDGTYRLVRR